MPALSGLNITVSIYRRVQQVDDEIGGSEQVRTLVYSGVPARITIMPSPMQLRTQGIENLDNFDCVVQPRDYTPLVIEFDDIIVPESGQYRNLDFVITNVYENDYADWPIDYRFIHKRLSLRRFEYARRVL